MAMAVAIIFLLGTIATGFAAPVDVEGTDLEGPVTKLMALEVLTGYPDGTFQPDGTITRAEFAAVAVRLLGLERAAQISAGSTAFTDVSADHWASGYINIASNRDIIAGYPDGTFEPGDNVTYAEALTILVRVLGYGPEADEQGNWPANYVSKAAELDITDDVSFAAGSPATRGDIAMMSDNSLDVERMVRVGYGDEATYEVDEDDTLLDRLGVEEVEGRVTDIARTDSRLDDDEIRIDGTVYKLDMANAEAIAEYIFGMEVEVLEKDDDIINVTVDSDYYFDAVEDLDEEELTLVDLDEELDISEDVVVYLNTESADIDELPEELHYAKVVLDEDDEVIFIDAFLWDGYMVVDEVDFSDEEIVGLEGDISLTNLDYEDYTFVKDGYAITVDDIQEGDILFYTETGDGYAEIYNNSFRGDIDDAFRDEFEINGEDYEYVNDIEANAKYIDEDGELDNFGQDEAEQMMDEGAVEIFLARNGEVVLVIGELGAAETDTFAALLYEDADAWMDYRDRGYLELQVITEEGEDVVYEIRIDDLEEITVDEDEYEEGEDYPGLTDEIDKFELLNDTSTEIHAFDEDGNSIGVVVDTENLVKGDVIEIVVDEDGDIVGFNFFHNEYRFTHTETIELDDDEVDGYLTTSNAVVFFAENDWDEDDVVVDRWRDLEDIEIDEAEIYFDDDAEIIYMVVMDSDYEETTEEEGIITAINRNSDDEITRVSIMIDGDEQTIRFDDAHDDDEVIQVADLVTIEIDDATGRAVDIEKGAEFTVTITVSDIDGINASSRRVEMDGTPAWYQLVSGGVIYDVSDEDDIETMSFAQLRRSFNDGELESVRGVRLSDGSRHLNMLIVSTEEVDDEEIDRDFELESIDATTATISGFVYDADGDNEYVLKVGEDFSDVVDVTADGSETFTGFTIEANGVYDIELYQLSDLETALETWTEYIQGN